MRYLSLDEMIGYIDRPLREGIRKLYHESKAEFEKHPGSQHNHQAWPGGYGDHIAEVMNLGRLIYHGLNDKRKLPFTLSDALVVLFLHDIEKAFPAAIAAKQATGLSRKAAKDEVRWEIVQNEDIWQHIDERMYNALKYAEGEGDEYSGNHRVMNELAAFVHACDVLSARLWHDRPREDHESWGYRLRS